MKVFKMLTFSTVMFFSTLSLAVDTPDSLEGAKIVSAKEASDLIGKGAKLFDVRVASEFAEEHIKGATSVPYGEKSKKEIAYDATQDKFDDSKLPAENMIFQCNGQDCWKSYKAAKWALGKGKKNVFWFRGGFPEWKTAGLPVEK
jgi:rhodanese-related sulfurtransferase